MQHTAVNLVTSWAGILYSSHIVALYLLCCHCRRRSYLSGITFLRLCL